MRYDNAVFEAAFGTFSQLPPSELTEIAFAGRSNVGKSSLLNKLFNRKSLARVSSVPGKTITINFYKLDEVRFVDLPGYGYAKVPHAEKLRWSEMMEGYFTSGRDIRLVVQLIDMRHLPTKQDMEMIEFLRQMEYPFVVVMTKSDKLKKTQREEQIKLIQEALKETEHVELVVFSAVTGEGVSELKDIIENAISMK